MSSPELFWSKTSEDGACLVWTAARTKFGHGVVWWEGRSHVAHRVAFFLRMGRWPESELLRHLCNRPECILHAVEGNRSENVRDSVLAGTHNMASKTHCNRDHEYTIENTRVRNGRRECRTCVRARDRDTKQRIRDAA